MRKFHSYGPVNSKNHYHVPRTHLVKKCTQYLIGDPDDSGHYFTIWGPRQTGKTWLYRQSIEAIKQQYGDHFILGEISMQGIVFDEHKDLNELFFDNIPDMLKGEFSIQTGIINSWVQWKKLFSKDKSFFDRPLILVIDEFDKLPKKIIENLVTLFRDMYLNIK